jgi:hypothetical protein
MNCGTTRNNKAIPVRSRVEFPLKQWLRTKPCKKYVNYQMCLHLADEGVWKSQALRPFDEGHLSPFLGKTLEAINIVVFDALCQFPLSLVHFYGDKWNDKP